MNKKRIMQRSFIFFFFLTLPFTLVPEEGMWPLSELSRLDLKSKGLEIGPSEVYNPQGISLVDGIINLSGCTASFVSGDGLILTNYHCAFTAVQSVTTEKYDYMRDGFFAESRFREVEARGYTVRIIDSYRDVSRKVLKAVKKKMSFAQRAKAVEKKIKEIVVTTEKKYPGKRAEVAEMFKGKTYVLFIYTYLRDIRLVYAPPRSIGEFGGEEDNWMWPRHTGDFALLRAYVAPDGSPADYAGDNVPYHPKKYLKPAPEGVKEGDFIFILGYPGRTYRHLTSHFISFEEEVGMPFVVDLYGRMISVMEKMSEKDRSTAIKLSPRIKGFWNRMKNYRGKLKGMKGLKLADRRRESEKKLQHFIDSDAKLKKKYGNLFREIEKLYRKKRENARYEMVLSYLNRSSTLLNYAYRVYEASIERQKPDTERESPYMERNFSRTRKRMIRQLRNYHEATDKILLKEMLMRAVGLEGDNRIKAVDDIVLYRPGADKSVFQEAIDAFIEDAYPKTRIHEETFLRDLFDKSTEELEKLPDPFIQLARNLYPTYQDLEETQKEHAGALNELLAHLIEVKKKFLGKEFIPDANGTLRLTHGRIRGYFPADAVYCSPLTTIRGIVEKHNTGKSYYQAPPRVLSLHQAKDFGAFKHPGLKDVPVGMLYDADTTGGNSGSPVLNSRGELVGLNFDRAFEATINDYGWSKTYSRSIGVDVRFILWFLQKFSGADHLLKEMGVLN